MAISEWHFRDEDGRPVTISYEVMTVQTVATGREPDEHWRYIDRAGHEHHYEPGYRTLTWVIDSTWWCDGSYGYAHHDEHEVEEGHYECPTCREHIAPGREPAGFLRHVPTGHQYYLQGEPITDAEASRIISNWLGRNPGSD